MFDIITREMIDQLDGPNRSQYERFCEIADSEANLSAEFIYIISELSSSLAVKSHTTGTEYKIALPLCDIIDLLLNSPRAGHYFVSNYRQEISDTKIDLCYASGYHQYASSRLSTFIMSTQYYIENVEQTQLAPGISRFAF